MANGPQLNFDDFLYFIESQHKLTSCIVRAKPAQAVSAKVSYVSAPKGTRPQPTPQHQNPQKPWNKIPSSNPVQNPIRCSGCGLDGHFLGNCAMWQAITPERKLLFAIKVGVCWNCLQPGHRYFHCTKPAACNACGGRHNEQICSAIRARPPPNIAPTQNPNRGGYVKSAKIAAIAAPPQGQITFPP